MLLDIKYLVREGEEVWSELKVGGCKMSWKALSHR